MSGFKLTPVKLISTKRRIEARCVKGYVYVPHQDPVKEEAQFYEDYVTVLHLKFGENSEELHGFKTAYKQCKEHEMTVNKFSIMVGWLFKGHDELILKFKNAVLPYLYPLATEEEVDRANHFLQSVKAAFPENKELCRSVNYLILKFQAGRLTTKDITVKMLELLKDRVDLVKAYLQLVPQAQNFVPQAKNIRNSTRFFVYPVIAAGLVVFAIGLGKMKK